MAEKKVKKADWGTWTVEEGDPTDRGGAVTIVVKIPNSGNAELLNARAEVQTYEDDLRKLRDMIGTLSCGTVYAAQRGVEDARDGVLTRVEQMLAEGCRALWCDVARTSECRYLLSRRQLRGLIAQAYCGQVNCYRCAQKKNKYTNLAVDNPHEQSVRAYPTSNKTSTTIKLIFGADHVMAV